MKLVLALLVVCAVAAFAFELPEEDYETIFAAYIKKHNKNYARDEVMSRFQIFKQNYQQILIHNNKPESERSGVVLGAGPLTDLTTAEYRQRLGLRLPNHVKASKKFYMAEGALNDDAKDWRTEGAVNDVKNQEQCGSCWAFSAVAAAEAALKISGKPLTSLSEQQLVDCTKKAPYNCEGCHGGIMHAAFQYMIDNKGLCSEKDYPYKAKDEKCKKIATTCTRDPFTSYENITCAVGGVCSKPFVPANETSELEAVNMGVLSVAVEADQAVFQNYHGGILDSKQCGVSLDHGVAIVGYGTENNKPYWIIRNSWGAAWGENGYIRIARGKNMCGVSLYSNIPHA